MMPNLYFFPAGLTGCTGAFGAGLAGCTGAFGAGLAGCTGAFCTGLNCAICFHLPFWIHLKNHQMVW